VEVDRSAHALIIDPRAAKTVYAATADGVLQSRDGGASWRPVNEGFPLLSDGTVAVSIRALVVDPRATTTLYAGGTPQYDPVTSTPGSGGVFILTQESQRWRRVNEGLPTSSDGTASVFALAVAPDEAGTIFAGTDQGVFRSNDSGRHWYSADAPIPDGVAGFIDALAVDPPTPSTVYAGTNAGIFKSTDGGSHWAATDLGSGPSINALAIDPQHPNIVYAGTSSGVLKSIDAGTTWTSASAGLGNEPAYPSVNALAIDPSRPDIVYAATTYGVFRSIHAGASWTAATSGLPTDDAASVLGVSAIAIDWCTSNTLYAGTVNGVFKSTSAGVLWSNQVAPQCVGDCDHDRSVSPDEIVAMTAIAGGFGDAAFCTNGDGNGDCRITVDEIVAAVTNAADGCPTPPPTATSTATPVGGMPPGTATPEASPTSGSCLGSGASCFVSFDCCSGVCQLRVCE